MVQISNDQNKPIRIAFYGDDFTGSTDALESLTRAGLRTVLFLDNPSPDKIERFGHLDAVGVAGMTRSMPPDEMTKVLNQSFSALAELNPKHVHYKICSTFDSSPEIGNIGTAIAVGNQIFGCAFTPVLVAAPHLGRYSAFGNLFARMGIGSQGNIYRLDRHPSMRTHPITPSSESDLSLHLSKQTDDDMGLINLLDIVQPARDIMAKLNAEIAAGKKIIFFDAIYENQMVNIGEILDLKADMAHPLFSVGSSGVEKALGDYWMRQGTIDARQQWELLSQCKPMLVLSGSVSPITSAQIDWAVNNGFKEIEVDPLVVENENVEHFVSHYQRAIVSGLQSGRSVILHTAKGPTDSRIQRLKTILNQKGWDEQSIRTQTARIFGKILGQSARRALEQFPVNRLVIAGGDTSSFIARELGIEAVEMIAPFIPGAPICRAYASGAPVDGIEVNLKGGQVGDSSYFCAIQNASP